MCLKKNCECCENVCAVNFCEESKIVAISELKEMKEMVLDIIKPKVNYTGDIDNMRLQANKASGDGLSCLLKKINSLIGR